MNILCKYEMLVFTILLEDNLLISQFRILLKTFFV